MKTIMAILLTLFTLTANAEWLAAEIKDDFSDDVHYEAVVRDKQGNRLHAFCSDKGVPSIAFVSKWNLFDRSSTPSVSIRVDKNPPFVNESWIYSDITTAYREHSLSLIKELMKGNRVVIEASGKYKSSKRSFTLRGSTKAIIKALTCL